jgi:UDP-N-acetylglucosamine/UDP-N-acetylgalactosamine 4-epimerase
MYTKTFHHDDISTRKFLVTGGAGFIGSNIVSYLLKYGAGKVVVLDNLSNGSINNLKAFKGDPDFEFIEGDITDIKTCLTASHGIDYVLHQAALGSVPRSVKDPLATNHANVTGFLNMLEASRHNKIKRFVYASSSSVYGDSAQLPKSEDTIGNPLSPYAASKRVNEIYAAVFSQTYNMQILGLRYFNIFGPGQSPNGPYAAVIPLFMLAALKNESPVVFGDGTQSRDFTFVENAVEANIKALFCPIEECNGSVFNVAVSEKTSINELYRIINDIAGNKNKPTYQKERTGDVKHSLADIGKAKAIMGYNPAINIKTGLNITFNWFREKYFSDAKKNSDV